MCKGVGDEYSEQQGSEHTSLADAFRRNDGCDYTTVLIEDGQLPWFTEQSGHDTPDGS